MMELDPEWSLIASEIPSLTIHRAERIGEGWAAVAWRVNGDLVIKFPKKAWVWGDLDREMAVLQHIRDRVPLAVPHYLHAVRESRGAAEGYVVYRHIPGSAVDPRALTPQETTALAATLATFLRALHDIDPGPLTAVLPRDDEHAIALQSRREAEVHVAPHLSVAERRRLGDAFAEHLDRGYTIPERHAIVHADFSSDHILRVGDVVTGIIDWGDVSLGDPDYDFNYLYEEFGEGFVREVGAYYGHSDPDRLVRKSRYFCIADQIATIVHGADDALPGDVDASWKLLRTLLSEET